MNPDQSLEVEHTKKRKTEHMFLFTGYGLNSTSLTGEEKTLTYHRYVEAFKFANGLKKHIRDPQFSSEEVSFTKCFSGYSYSISVLFTLNNILN